MANQVQWILYSYAAMINSPAHCASSMMSARHPPTSQHCALHQPPGFCPCLGVRLQSQCHPPCQCLHRLLRLSPMHSPMNQRRTPHPLPHPCPGVQCRNRPPSQASSQRCAPHGVPSMPRCPVPEPTPEPMQEQTQIKVVTYAPTECQTTNQVQ